MDITRYGVEVALTKYVDKSSARVLEVIFRHDSYNKEEAWNY